MKLLQLFLCCALLQCAAAKLTHSQLVKKFNELTSKSNVQTLHSSADLREHFLEFKATANFIESHNAMEGQRWKAGYNEFSTMTAAERNVFTGINVSETVDYGQNSKVATRIVSTKENPKHLDYIKYLPFIKYQANCGSCWSFPATAALEYRLNKDSGETFSTTDYRGADLSEQMYVDCTYAPGGGCGGGWMHKAWEWTTANGQKHASTEDYPYRGDDDMDCYAADVENAISGYEITGHVWMERGGANLENALVEHGVITSVVEADGSFFSYDEGIFTGNDKCEAYNHAVAVVGYGEEGGVGYWTVRNSWGIWRGWGEEGHIRIQRGLQENWSGCLEKVGLWPVVIRTDDDDNNEEKEEEEEVEDVQLHWCRYKDKFLEQYAPGGTIKWNTLEEATSRCLQLSACNGVTYEPNTSKYTLRRGPTLEDSTSWAYISWKICQEDEKEEEEEEEQDVRWCRYDKRYLANWAWEGGKYIFDTLEEATSKCLIVVTCNGVTRGNSESAQYELRKGPTLGKSSSKETSWKICSS